MPKQIIITKVDKSRWTKAQKNELLFADHNHEAGDDWNQWWKEKFDNYKFIEGKNYVNVLETGCGPHTNIRLMLSKINVQNIFLEDPLMRGYLEFANKTKSVTIENNTKKSLLRRSKKTNTVVEQPLQHHLKAIFENPKYRVDLSAAPLENLPYRDGMMDMIICINVLDHVEDVEKCMNEMYRVLKKGGLLILGQDLSNKEDYKLCPESWEDVCHPIKVDEKTMDSFVKGYKKVFYKLLPRDEGRNPAAHYGTYLLIGKKN